MTYYQSQERKGIAEEGEWLDKDLAVKADTPLIDSASGKKLIIRVFDFQWKKGIKREEMQQAKNNKQELFNSYAKYIRDFLWKDGLSVREDHDPKMIFNKTGYRIAVLCEARFGLNIFEKGATLQGLMQDFNKKSIKKK